MLILRLFRLVGVYARRLRVAANSKPAAAEQPSSTSAIGYASPVLGEVSFEPEPRTKRT